MAGAFVDGALKGFNMMERHQERLDNKARLSDIDAFEKKKYSDQQGRLADIDKQKAMQREQDVAFRNKQFDSEQQYRTDTLSDLDRSFKEKQKNSLWRQKYEERDQLWKQDQINLPPVLESIRETGRVPEEHEEMMARNKALDPRTYLDPQKRKETKELGELLNNIAKTGKVAEINTPRGLELANMAFASQLNSTVGQYNDQVKSKVADNKIVSYVPLGEGKDIGKFGLELEVTYENGMKERKPMTKGRTSDLDDPVMVYTPKELFGAVNSRVMVADMMDDPERWEKINAQMDASLGRTTKPAKEAPQESEYRKHYLKLAQRREEALSELGKTEVGKAPLTEEQKKAQAKQIESEFQALKAELDGVFGKQVKDLSPKEESGDKGYADFSDDELMSFIYGSSGAK